MIRTATLENASPECRRRLHPGELADIPPSKKVVDGRHAGLYIVPTVRSCRQLVHAEIPPRIDVNAPIARTEHEFARPSTLQSGSYKAIEVAWPVMARSLHELHQCVGSAGSGRPQHAGTFVNYH